MLKLNIGSGQRRLDGWVNCDVQSRPPDQVPDLLFDARGRWPFEDNSADIVLLHQVYEHFHLSEGRPVLQEAHRVLAPGGRLIVTVPDLRALCNRWLTRQIDDYIFCVNLFGGWQGLEGDDHHWAWCRQSLGVEISSAGCWSSVHSYDWKDLEVVKAWWVLGIEAVK
mgnify:CR=1 FL=1